MFYSDDWWRVRWEAAGFVYSEFLTKKSRSIALKDQQLKNLTLDMRDDHLYFVGQHIYLNVQVFINPMVASLPEHSHLFAEVSVYICIMYGVVNDILSKPESHQIILQLELISMAALLVKIKMATNNS